MKKILDFLTGNVIGEIGKVIDNLFTTDEERLEADGNIGEFKISKEYIPIFQTLLVTTYGAYFVGRTWEKTKQKDK